MLEDDLGRTAVGDSNHPTEKQNKKSYFTTTQQKPKNCHLVLFVFHTQLPQAGNKQAFTFSSQGQGNLHAVNVSEYAVKLGTCRNSNAEQMGQGVGKGGTSRGWKESSS